MTVPPSGPRGGPIYKILPTAQWRKAGESVPWAPVDRTDGFVHLSAAHQVRQTAAKHFAGQADLTLLEIDPGQIPNDRLRWECSRNNDEFPHVYGDLPRAAVVDEAPLALAAAEHAFGPTVPEPLPDRPTPCSLVRRFEIAETRTLIAFARAAKRHGHPNTACFSFGSSVAAFFGERSPLNAAKGWALDREPAAAQLDELEDFFFQRGVACTIELASHAHPQAMPLLCDRGYRALAVINVLFRELDTVPQRDGELLRPIGPNQAKAWAQLQASAQTGQSRPPEHIVKAAEVSCLAELGQVFAIRHDEHDVGTCAVRYDHEVLRLSGAAICPNARRQGLYRRSMLARMAHGRRLGCRIAKLDVRPGSEPHRSAHRSGFRLSHTRIVWTREPQ